MLSRSGFAVRAVVLVALGVWVGMGPATLRSAAEEAGRQPVDRLVGRRAGDFRLPDVRTGNEVWLYGLRMNNGGVGRLLGFKPVQAVVLVFVSPGCPLGDKYLPRLDELAAEYGPKGVRFFGVASGAGETRESLAAWAAERKPSFPILHDAGNVQADALMVERSNEALVIDLRATIRYRGAIDDQYGYDFSREAPRETPLRDALDAVLGQGELVVKATPVAGCLLTKVAAPKSKLEELDRVRPLQADLAAWLDEHEPAPAVGAVTYHRDVAPVVQARCQACHRPGQVGGFDLLTHADAFRQSAMIAEVVEQRRMPPWHADPRHGHFSNDRRLTPRERATLLAWVKQGCPEGDPADTPAPRTWPEGWTIGTPDVVFEIPEANAIPAQGTMPYIHVSVPTNFTADTWVQAAEARPGDAGVVHHIIVFVVPPGGNRGRAIAGGQGHLCGYAPGDMPSVYPLGTAKRIKAGSTLVFQLHYTPNGWPTTDRSKVGFILAKEPPTREALTIGIANPGFVIPPGAPAHPVRSQQRVRGEVRLLSFMPHMHLRGRSFRYTLTGASEGAEPEVLLDVPAFDFGWQSYYTLAEPRILPQGSLLVCDATFDNSSGNPANPDPTSVVSWGEQTWEEMMIGYIDVDMPVGADALPDDAGPRRRSEGGE
ncbi:MAG: peroxiredoxin [Planctomycetia bacterium]|nr:peroxiredoxin [Planctomycetia bacterium]